MRIKRRRKRSPTSDEGRRFTTTWSKSRRKPFHHRDTEDTEKTLCDLCASVVKRFSRELANDPIPLAAFAQQPLDQLAERRVAAACIEFPCRRRMHLGGSIQ